MLGIAEQTSKALKPREKYKTPSKECFGKPRDPTVGCAEAIDVSFG